MFKSIRNPGWFIHVILLILVCFQVQVANAKKKGFVTIATLGPSPVKVSANTEPQQVVNRVIAHWRSQFARVLPDKPDLIVVPEACDRPRGLSSEKQTAYFLVRKNQVRAYFARSLTYRLKTGHMEK